MNNYRLTPLRNTTENKKRIIDNARNEMYMRQVKSHKRRWLPVLVSIFLVIISLFITAPYINNAFFNKDSYTIEKVVIPNVPYDSLITSTYVEEKNEFIYNTDSGFYVFDVENSEQSMLVSTNGIGRIFDYAVSEKWLVWAQPVNDEDKIHVLNRETLEQKILDIASFRGIRLVQDMIFYLNIGDESKSINYMKFNLLTEKTEVLREFEGDSNSKPAIDGNQIAISEKIVINDQIQTSVSIHNIETLENQGSYILPYEIAQNVQLKDYRFFGLLWNDNEMDLSVIGAIDLEENNYTELESPVGIHDFATDGKHFAISVQKGDSDTVQLFNLEEGQLKRTSTKHSIKERLVKPRFTDQGTLVLNGEGSDRAMYLIRFE